MPTLLHTLHELVNAFGELREASPRRLDLLLLLLFTVGFDLQLDLLGDNLREVYRQIKLVAHFFGHAIICVFAQIEIKGDILGVYCLVFR